MARFTRKGKSKLWFVPTLTSTTSPSITEIQAGTEITGQVSDMSGWTFESTRIPTPNMADVFTPQIAGEDQVGTPTVTIYDDDSGAGGGTIRTALAKDAAGYLVHAPYGLTATKKCRVYPIQSSGPNDEITVANEPARFVVGFAITSPPKTDSTLAA